MTQIAQKTLRDYLQATEDAISKGSMDEAESKCQDILAQFPDSLEAQRLLGEVYLAKGALQEAQQAFDWVLTNDPENVIAYCDRALISERQDDYDTALDCYQQAYELSRGNSKIRQEFNILSQKAGQQGFMLSRAGLARLYMRGDLLTQAIQEWEMVLALAPDRLDARTGLLETYWREGLYERVEQLATQILHDVPGCEKALLLLSYVTSLKDKTQAQNFIRRVETLDPDLLMAHDLFSDLLSSQPADPFLNLLKKPPVVLSSLSTGTTGSGTFGREENAFPTPTLAEPASAIWDSLQAWPGAKNDLPFPAMPESGQDMPSSSIWSDKQAFDDRVWSDFASSKPSDQSIYPEEPTIQKKQPQPEALFRARTDQQEEAIMEHPEAQPEPWEALQDALGKINAEGGNLSSLSPEIWATLDKYLQNGSNAALGDLQLPSREEPVAPEPVFAEPAYESTGSSPSWMNSLDQSPRRQVSGSLNGLNTPPTARQNDPSLSSAHMEKSATTPPSTWSASTSQNRQPEAPASSVPPTPQSAEKLKTASTWQAKAEPNKPELSPTEEEDEDLLFGPAWLRSLGAAGMDDEEEATYDKDKTISPEEAATHLSAQPLSPTPRQPEPKAETASSWSSTAEVKPASNSTQAGAEPSWMNSLQPMSPSSAREATPANNNTPPAADPSWMNTFQSMTPSSTANGTQPDVEPSWMSSLQSMSQPATDPRAESSWIDALRQSPEPSWLSSLQPSTEPSWMDALQPQGDTNTDFASPYTNGNTPTSDANGDYNWSNSFGVIPETNWNNAMAYPADTSWSQPLNEAIPSEQANDPLLATLRDLDQGLLAQGFVPLEPNSLSSLALPEEPLPYVEPLPQKPQPYVEPSLSSALAELGGFSSQPAPQVKENSPVKPVEERYGQEAGLWTTPAAPTPISRPVVPEKVQPAAYTEVDPAIVKTPTSIPAPEQFPYASTPAARTPRAPEQTRQSWNFRPSTGSGEAMQAPIVHIDPLLDSELETTMKRPAIRMEAMQQSRMGGVKEPAPSPSSTPGYPAKGRTSGNRGGEPGLTNQERLMAGYQHQLVGDYDEAMQEYRIIIRGAPDLLSEVISNIRALLKLAPKYSAGYRVLGDAYMRQGEYLQAMEAYNKALTMAKKKGLIETYQYESLNVHWPSALWMGCRS